MLYPFTFYMPEFIDSGVIIHFAHQQYTIAYFCNPQNLKFLRKTSEIVISYPVKNTAVL